MNDATGLIVPTPVDMTPDQYCQQKAAQSGSSFYYSFLFLPPERRRAIISLYAFCRELDDVVDECSNIEVAKAKLAWWRDQIAAVYSGTPSHPVAIALAVTVRQYGLDRDHVEEFVRGMEMDLTEQSYANFEALELYCYRVAGVVGLMSARIFGYRNAATLRYAQALGTAFQLTNIIRDVGEDAGRNRVYLPRDELDRYRIPASDILRGRVTSQFGDLIAFQIQRARNHYRDALALLPVEDRRSQRPGLVMAAIYQTLLDEISTDCNRVLTARTSLTPIRKLWIAWLTWIKC